MSGERGYSLLELLLALALLGFITLAMAGGFRFGTRAWERSEDKVASIERIQGAQRILRTLLQGAVPRDLDPSQAGDPELFRGTGRSLSFVANASSTLGGGGAVRYRLLIEGIGERRNLVLAWRAAGSERRLAVLSAREISLAYARRDQTGRLIWAGEWLDQSGAPALVRVRASLEDGVWPDLIVRLRIMRDPSCLYNPDTFECRHA